MVTLGWAAPLAVPHGTRADLTYPTSKAWSGCQFDALTGGRSVLQTDDGDRRALRPAHAARGVKLGRGLLSSVAGWMIGFFDPLENDLLLDRISQRYTILVSIS